MANQIRIPTKLDTSGVKTSVKDIEKTISELKRTFNKDVNSFQREIDKISNSLDKSKNKTKAYADELKRLFNDKTQAESEYDEASKRQHEAFVNNGADSKEYKEAVRQTQLRQQALDKINKQISDIKAKGRSELETQSQLSTQLEDKKALLEEYKVKSQDELSTKYEELETAKMQLETEKQQEAQIKAHNKALKKSVGNIKNLTLGLIGARTLYAGIRKIIGEVTSENKALQNTIQGFWGSLGALFEPIINYVIQGLATILNYAMKVIQVITGVNMLAKAQRSIAKKNGADKGGNLASFDKSEVLNKNDGAGNSNESFLKDVQLNEDLLAIAKAIKGVWDKIVKVTKDWVKTLDFTKLSGAVKNLLSSIAPLIDSIGNVIVSIYERAILPIAKFVIESALPFFLNTIANYLKVIKSVIDILLPPLEYLWDNIIKPFAEQLGNVISGVLDNITQKQNELVAWFDENGEHIVERLMEIGEKIVEFYNTYIAPIVAIIMDVLGVGLQGAIEIAWGILQEFLDNIDTIIDDVEGILDGIIEFLTGVFTGDWEMAWNGVLNIFRNIWNGIIDIVQSVLNGVVAGVNAIIDAINKLSWDIPDWVPGLGGKHFGFNISHIHGFDLSGFKFEIPKLAQGGVLQPNKPFLAMLGDQKQGRNIEAPEDLIRQIVAEESGKNITINASGDIGQLIRFLKFELDKENKRVGTKLVID